MNTKQHVDKTEMEMEPHGGVSFMKRLTRHRNYEPIIVALAPEYAWRATVRTRLLTCSSLRAPHTSGRAGGPDSTCRDHWML